MCLLLLFSLCVCVYVLMLSLYLQLCVCVCACVYYPLSLQCICNRERHNREHKIYSVGRIEPGITAESSNKRQGGGEDEGMRPNRGTEIGRALHEVRLLRLLLLINKRDEQERERERGREMESPARMS